jgi:hypothetical protein
VHATPAPGAEFVTWQRMASTGLVNTVATLSTTFLVSADSNSGIHVGVFRDQCLSATASPTGNGTLDFYPASNCTTIAGNPGYTIGTNVFAYPTGQLNPTLHENDIFYTFGTLPAGVSLAKDSANRPYVTFTIADNTSIPVTFGPRCRTVTVAFSPAVEGDTSAVETAPN